MTGLMNVKEVAAYLHVSHSAIHGWILRKGFPRKKVGHLVRFDLAEVNAWVAQQTELADNDIRAKQDAHKLLKRHDPGQPVVFTLD
jgi:excisionase family DNA binding protein